MDPSVAVSLGLTLLDETIVFIKSIKGQTGLTPEQLVAIADAQDLKNKDDIKALLAL